MSEERPQDAPDRGADAEVQQRILRANIEHHDRNVALYECSHPNLSHFYERYLLRQDLAELERLLAGRKVQALDVGAGTGRLTLEFARRGWDVTALDCSREMLRVLGDRYQMLPDSKGSLSLMVASAEEFMAEDDRQFDLIAFSSVLHHLPGGLEILEVAAGRLTEGGCLYITQEPLPVTAPRKSPVMRTVRLLDDLCRLPQLLHRACVRIKVPKHQVRHGDMVDYHVPAGLDIEAVEEKLAAAGVHRQHLRRYKDHKSGAVAWLDTNLLHTPNWHFRYIGQSGD